MSEFEIKEKQAILEAKQVILESTIKLTNTRMDSVEDILREELAEIKADLKEVIAWMNRSLGWAAAFLLFGGIIGFILEKLIK